MEYNDDPDHLRTLTLAADQPLVGIVCEEDGRPMVQYVAGDRAAAMTGDSDETLQAALAVIGAWSELDWEEFAADLDRIRHESRPTPPTDL